MSTRTSGAFLWDAKAAIADAREFVGGQTYEEYAADRRGRAAVERALITIGEALSQFRQMQPAAAGRLPSLRKAVAFRNIIVHAYAHLKHEIVWATIHEDLPVLEAELDALLREFGG